jgi:hypothetical protein
MGCHLGWVHSSHGTDEAHHSRGKSENCATPRATCRTRFVESDGTWLEYCWEIPVVGTIMDTSVRCTPGESWPYYLANRGCTARARCSGSAEYTYEIHPHRVPTFRRGTWLLRTTPDSKVRVRFPVIASPCNPSTGYGPFAYDAGC